MKSRVRNLFPVCMLTILAAPTLLWGKLCRLSIVLHKLVHNTMHFPGPRSLLLILFSEFISAFQKSQNSSIKHLSTVNTTSVLTSSALLIHTHKVSLCGVVSQHFQHLPPGSISKGCRALWDQKGPSPLPSPWIFFVFLSKKWVIFSTINIMLHMPIHSTQTINFSVLFFFFYYCSLQQWLLSVFGEKLFKLLINSIKYSLKPGSNTQLNRFQSISHTGKDTIKSLSYYSPFLWLTLEFSSINISWFGVFFDSDADFSYELCPVLFAADWNNFWLTYKISELECFFYFSHFCSLRLLVV